jgi:hypothetical protein
MKIAYDCQLKRPACVLVAAGMGADSSLAQHFNTQDWLLAPTPDMAVYECTPDQLAKLVKITEAHKRK